MYASKCLPALVVPASAVVGCQGADIMANTTRLMERRTPSDRTASCVDYKRLLQLGINPDMAAGCVCPYPLFPACHARV